MASGFASSMLATLVRGTTGIRSNPAPEKPQQLLELYDIENCPYCRLVREALTELDIDAIIYPCPKNGERFRPELEERGGKAQFPYLVDPNTDIEMYESLDIVDYLYTTYGKSELPLKWRAAKLQMAGSMLASASRKGEGLTASATPGAVPEKMLELFSFESSPFARFVREFLCEQQIPYVLRNCGRSGLQDWMPPVLRQKMDGDITSTLENRRTIIEREGMLSIPYLIDPNSGEGMFESQDIIDYLAKTYAA